MTTNESNKQIKSTELYKKRNKLIEELNLDSHGFPILMRILGLERKAVWQGMQEAIEQWLTLPK